MLSFCPEIHDKWIKPSGNLWSQSEMRENQAFGFSPSVLMVVGKIVTNVEKLLPLKLGFFSPSSSVEKLASIVSHFYKSLSSIVIPFTKECDIIFPNHLPNCLLAQKPTALTPWFWNLTNSSCVNLVKAGATQLDKGQKGQFSLLAPLCFVVVLHLLLFAFKTVFNRAVFFTLVQLSAACLLPFFLSCWS